MGIGGSGFSVPSPGYNCAAQCWLTSSHLRTMLMGMATTTTAHLASVDSTTTPKYWLRRRLRMHVWYLLKKIVAHWYRQGQQQQPCPQQQKQQGQQQQWDTFEDPRSWPEEVQQVQEEASLDDCTSMVQLQEMYVKTGMHWSWMSKHPLPSSTVHRIYGAAEIIPDLVWSDCVLEISFLWIRNMFG